MAKSKVERPRASRSSTASASPALCVQDLMTSAPRACSPGESANEAARIMWERDCGAVPIVDEGRVVGIVTDRDVCMAAYFQGVPLASIRLADIMTTNVCTCRAEDQVSTAEGLMRDRQINRLPVVADGGLLVGMLSLCDLTQGVSRAGALRQKTDQGQTLLETVAAIHEPRRSDAAAAAAPERSV